MLFGGSCWSRRVIANLTAADVARERSALVALLVDAVASGASVGFLPPLSNDDADRYWRDIENQVEAGSRIVLVARLEGRILGTVQLDLCLKPNGPHRAEVQRLLVHTDARRNGIGRRLMLAVETEALRMGRHMLVLDTRQGDPSESLYRGIGYVEAGAIPNYALSSDGSYHATVLMYKMLGDTD